MLGAATAVGERLGEGREEQHEGGERKRCPRRNREDKGPSHAESSPPDGDHQAGATYEDEPPDVHPMLGPEVSNPEREYERCRDGHYQGEGRERPRTSPCCRHRCGLNRWPDGVVEAHPCSRRTSPSLEASFAVVEPIVTKRPAPRTAKTSTLPSVPSSLSDTAVSALPQKRSRAGINAYPSAVRITSTRSNFHGRPVCSRIITLPSNAAAVAVDHVPGTTVRSTLGEEATRRDVVTISAASSQTPTSPAVFQYP